MQIKPKNVLYVDVSFDTFPKFQKPEFAFQTLNCTKKKALMMNKEDDYAYT